MQKILIAETLKPLLMQRDSPFRRADAQVFTASTNDELLRVHIEEEVNLIVSRLDLPGASAEQVFSIIRQGRALRKVSIMLICEATVLQKERCRHCGANTIMTVPVDPARLQVQLQQFLTIALRQSYRVVLNVVVDGRFRNRSFLCRTENISTAGMLIRTDLGLSPGEGVSFSFYLPEGTKVVAHGEVVRIVKQAAGSDEQCYGIKYTNIAEDARARIDAYVKKEEGYRFTASPDQRPLLFPES
jgi:CheY-like chemotaxis protein